MNTTNWTNVQTHVYKKFGLKIGDFVKYNADKNPNRNRPLKRMNPKNKFQIINITSTGLLHLHDTIDNKTVPYRYNPVMFDKINQEYAKEQRDHEPRIKGYQAPEHLKENRWFYLNTRNRIYKIVFEGERDVVLQDVNKRLHVFPRDSLYTQELTRSITKAEFALARIAVLTDGIDIPAHVKTEIDKLARFVLDSN